MELAASRRWLVRAGFLALLFVAGGQACRGGAPPEPERAWSVQLHLHGSFSEGLGSLDSHGYEASDVGCDVLWWSDHDFRVTGHEHVSRFGFEAWEEPLDRNEPWRTRLEKYRGDVKRLQFARKPAGARASFVEAPVREGARSLRLALEAPAEEPLELVLGAERKLQRRTLASGLVLGLGLWPESLPPDARVVCEVMLSEHAPRAGLGLEPRYLRYEIAAGPATPARRQGATFVVPVSCEPGRWNELALALTADAVRGFPETPGEDNVLYRLTLGLAAPRGGAAVFLDDLRLDASLSGAPVYARQARLIDEVGSLYPGLFQLQGLEVSYDSRHLNLFCEDTPLPDYEALARDVPAAEDGGYFDARAFRERVVQWVLSETHARGGLVSYNHPFGATFEEGEKARSNEEQLAILLRNRAEGADLLEVGYRERGGASLDDHLWLWDQAALAGLRLVGTGVSDSHGGDENRWRGQPNNFVSWVYAPRPDKASLIAGLRAGRVFFGDLERFDGTLDLRADSGERMGATLLTERAELEVELLATGTEPGHELVLVESGVRTRRFPVTSSECRERVRVALAGPGPFLVRVELHDASGAIALSNPLHLLRPAR